MDGFCLHARPIHLIEKDTDRRYRIYAASRRTSLDIYCAEKRSKEKCLRLQGIIVFRLGGMVTQVPIAHLWFSKIIVRLLKKFLSERKYGGIICLQDKLTEVGTFRPLQEAGLVSEFWQGKIAIFGQSSESVIFQFRSQKEGNKDESDETAQVQRYSHARLGSCLHIFGA